MESLNTNFWIWLSVIGAVGGFGLVALLQAYLGRGGKSCIFAEPQPIGELASTDEDAQIIQTALTKAAAAFTAGRYRWAIDQYSLAVQTQVDLAMAYHNRGLAAANLRQNQDAARDLAKAAELYLDQDNPVAAQLVFEHLQTLKSLR
jgi:tetratricopeptide (TPR) repeat protein